MLKKTKVIVKWMFISLLMGAVGGIVGSLFHYLIELVTHVREERVWLILLLPLAGIVIAGIYHPFKNLGKLNTNRIITSVEDGESVPIVLAPLIFAGTLITHLFGGSAGREGAALQLGGSLGSNIGRLFKLSKDESRVIVMTGMSSFFSAMFGTPLTAAVFTLEVINTRNIHRKSAVPCVISSVTAYVISCLIGLEGVRYSVEAMNVSALVIVKTIALAALCALVSIVLCFSIKHTSKYMKKFISNDYIRAFAGGTVIVLLSIILRTTDYNGAGMDVIGRAMNGEASYLAFILKIVFVSITIASGFRGGEIVPTLFVGATFGCAFGSLLGLESAFAASLGFAALFAAVVKCPISAIVLAFEVFGVEGIILYAIACTVTYFLSGNFSIYEHKLKA